jgi:predicted  nucleic acid-binding Zn-ribbon protein
MKQEHKNNLLSSLNNDIQINQTRLDNAEQSVQMYLDKLKGLTEQLSVLVNTEVDG